jgi:hypothetical protein
VDTILEKQLRDNLLEQHWQESGTGGTDARRDGDEYSTTGRPSSTGPKANTTRGEPAKTAATTPTAANTSPVSRASSGRPLRGSASGGSRFAKYVGVDGADGGAPSSTFYARNKVVIIVAVVVSFLIIGMIVWMLVSRHCKKRSLELATKNGVGVGVGATPLRGDGRSGEVAINSSRVRRGGFDPSDRRPSEVGDFVPVGDFGGGEAGGSEIHWNDSASLRRSAR